MNSPPNSFFHLCQARCLSSSCRVTANLNASPAAYTHVHNPSLSSSPVIHLRSASAAATCKAS
jgi:hypothetical protein